MNEEISSRLDNISTHKNVLDALRHIDSFDLKSIASCVNLSWPTVKSSIDHLLENKMIRFEKGSDTKKIVINKSYCCYMGIAIGATETKVSFVDLSLKPIDIYSDQRFTNFISKVEEKFEEKSLSNEYLCFPTEPDYIKIYNSCSWIIDAAIEFFADFENKPVDLPLLAIGITLPGIIDKNTNEMAFCPNIPCLVGMPISRLISGDIQDKLKHFGIPYYVYHDTVAVAVFEKENLYSCENDMREYKDKKNVASLYWGYGLGGCFIMNNSLVLGASGAIGEIGHVQVDYNDLIADGENEEKDCANYNKNPNIGLNDESSKCSCLNESCLERIIRVKVFNSNNINDFKQKTTEAELKVFPKNHPYRYKVLKFLIGRALNLIVNLLNVDLVILSGKIFSTIPSLRHDLQAEMTRYSLKASAKYCQIISGCSRYDIVALGAAILAYYNLNDSDKQFNGIDWDYIS